MPPAQTDAGHRAHAPFRARATGLEEQSACQVVEPGAGSDPARERTLSKNCAAFFKEVVQVAPRCLLGPTSLPTRSSGRNSCWKLRSSAGVPRRWAIWQDHPAVLRAGCGATVAPAGISGGAVEP